MLTTLGKPTEIRVLKLTDVIASIELNAKKATLVLFEQYRNASFNSKINQMLLDLYTNLPIVSSYFNKPSLGEHQPFLTFAAKKQRLKNKKHILELLQLFLMVNEWNLNIKMDRLFKSLSAILETNDKATLKFDSLYNTYLSTFSMKENFITKFIASRFVEVMKQKIKKQKQEVNFELSQVGNRVHVKNFMNFQIWLNQNFNCCIPEANYLLSEEYRQALTKESSILEDQPIPSEEQPIPSEDQPIPSEEQPIPSEDTADVYSTTSSSGAIPESVSPFPSEDLPAECTQFPLRSMQSEQSPFLLDTDDFYASLFQAWETEEEFPFVEKKKPSIDELFGLDEALPSTYAGSELCFEEVPPDDFKEPFSDRLGIDFLFQDDANDSSVERQPEISQLEILQLEIPQLEIPQPEKDQTEKDQSEKEQPEKDQSKKDQSEKDQPEKTKQALNSEISTAPEELNKKKAKKRERDRESQTLHRQSEKQRELDLEEKIKRLKQEDGPLSLKISELRKLNVTLRKRQNQSPPLNPRKAPVYSPLFDLQKRLRQTPIKIASANMPQRKDVKSKKSKDLKPKKPVSKKSKK
ncbi:MAG: bZIP transcription factor [Candidatus Berkiellales bacterium]